MEREYELYHYGKKGMKWGVRRTPEQLRRLSGKLETKNDKLRAKFEIEKNEKLHKMYNNTIKGLDAGTIEAGRVFMRYKR